MKTNYMKEQDALLDKLGGKKPGLLLHCCCGPCACPVFELLQERFEITAFYFNPNTGPQEEYLKRLSSLKQLILSAPYSIPLIEGETDSREFDKLSAGLEAEKEGGKRCEACFRLRLEKTARTAKELGFEYFCTTLTTSPRKDPETINAIGSELAGRFGVLWLPSDFKKRGGYLRSAEMSEKYGLYRQNYCGCEYSRRPIAP
ncbi:MAG: epoxyqueuosine reductase QueH [Oscillospiraceae bacterium]|nr:epoxyqueuosine reductase QueH [Oscillospiraceae bacterium]